MDPSQPGQQQMQSVVNQGASYGQKAVEMARLSSDTVVLIVTFAVFSFASIIYFIASYVQSIWGENVSGLSIAIGVLGSLFGALLFFGVVLGLGMFIVRMQRQTMLGNSLQVQYSGYAWLREWTGQVAMDLNMPQVEIYITQDPYINAYAFGFAKPYVIVLNSGSIRYLTKDELKAVAVHEMAHIKYSHTLASVFLAPFMLVPVISIVAGWLSGFWQRRAELTADRLALMYLRDSELVKKSLIKVHVGPDVAEYMNDTARQWLSYTAERPMNRLAQTFSSHPFLVRRLDHIDRYKSMVATAQQPAPMQDSAR